MVNVSVPVPQELLDQLAQSALADLDESRRVSVALAVHLFTSEQVSIGRAAELAGMPLVEFQDVLRALDLPVAFYGPEELAQDMETIAAMDEERSRGRGR